MATILLIFFILSNVLWTSCKLNDINDDVNLSRSYVYWPNATIPFYINPEHFDSEQSQSILSSLSLFAFRTCLQFKPVMVEPVNHHVLLIENPTGRRKCDISVDAHSFEEPHRITVGYECLQSPHIEMTIMRALGFPFEHNRASRDVFIDVQFENIEPGSMDLFTKDKKLPLELRSLPYDVNSVTHFGERDFSKNGHRTIIFKERNIKQNRVGLSPTDLRKIEIVYGAECLKRDRQAKVDLCKQYPGPVRKKRDLLERSRSLRVNPDITPPPDNVSDASDSIKQLGIIDELDRIIQDVYKLNALALDNARTKYCNDTKEILRSDGKSSAEGSKPDILGIIQLISEYTRNIVDNAVTNLTEFCETSQSVDKFFRSRCGWYDSSNSRCPQYFKSTKSGPVKFSTQHRPTYHQSTKHKGRAVVYNYDNFGMRSGPEPNVTDSNNTTRSKRNVASVINTEVTDDVNVKSNATDTVIIHGAKSKDVLRMATRVIYSQKGIDYAPVKRRFAKSNRIHKQDQETQERQRELGRKRHKTDWSDDDQTGKMTDTIQIAEREIDGNRVQRLKPRGIRKESGIPKTVRLSKENKEFYDERKWPDRIVRYVITDDQRYDLEDMRSRLEEVGNILKNSTCVRIQEITEDEADNVMDYLVLDTSPDYVTGRVGGRQIFGVLELFRGGQHRQHAAMMVMAMLGFYFEVSRHDRDKYIRVHNRHIRPDKLHHFEKIRADATLPLPYDYEGATHPAWQFWRKVGKKGISTVATYKDLDPDGEIMKSLGQNEQLLSKYDLMKINSVYGVRCFRSQRRMKIVES